jgi:hypothetical protein
MLYHEHGWGFMMELSPNLGDGLIGQAAAMLG